MKTVSLVLLTLSTGILAAPIAQPEPQVPALPVSNPTSLLSSAPGLGGALKRDAKPQLPSIPAAGSLSGVTGTVTGLTGGVKRDAQPQLPSLPAAGNLPDTGKFTGLLGGV